MLKTGDVDIAYDLDAQAAEEVKRNPKFRLAFSGGIRVVLSGFPRAVGPEVAVA